MGTTTGAEGSSGTSRRALLKGAVAAGVGAAVYASPVVSTVPAYAVHGLSSWSSESGTLCLWFSPNQQDEGQWHRTGQDGNEINSPPTRTYEFTVGGIARQIQFSGDPNNIPGSSGLGVVGETATYWGGGVGITLLTDQCQVVVQGVVCNQNNNGSSTCSTTSLSAAPATWAVGSSESPIDQSTAPNGNVGGGVFAGESPAATVYYHSGRTGRGDGDRCKWSMLFKLQCR